MGKLNWHSIGIEVDNAMMLVEQKDGTFVRRTTVIPPEQVECIRHWKLFKEKPWQKFTQTQLKVTFKVVEALARFYPVEEILEHERVSLAIRNDPGPLFPMEALRLDVLKREQPSFQLFRTKKETPLFENSCWLPPVIPHEQFPNLKKVVVKVLDSSCNFWAKIEVVKNIKGQADGRIGWVRMTDIRQEGKAYRVTRETEFYRVLPEPEKHGPPCRQLAVLPIGTQVRRQVKREDGWSLIATPEHKIGFLFLEGWVRSENLEPA